MLIATAALLALAWTPQSQTADAAWNRFRGPNGTGIAEGEYPAQIGPEADTLWMRSFPSGGSSPVLSHELVFLTGIENDRLVTLAFDKKTGKPAWRKAAPKVKIEKVHKTNSPATPTPLVDDKQVYVYFGSYGLICYDHAGETKWEKPIPTPKSLYGASTSPIAFGDLLIQVLDNESNLPGSRLSQSKILAVKRSNGDKGC